MAEETGGSKPRRTRPATTPDGREAQLISAAIDLVEKRIRDGTATAQETVHFLKLGSSRERLEQERLREENQLMATKRKQIEKGQDMETLFANAMQAFSGYSGEGVPDTDA